MFVLVTSYLSALCAVQMVFICKLVWLHQALLCYLASVEAICLLVRLLSCEGVNRWNTTLFFYHCVSHLKTLSPAISQTILEDEVDDPVYQVSRSHPNEPPSKMTPNDAFFTFSAVFPVVIYPLTIELEYTGWSMLISPCPANNNHSSNTHSKAILVDACVQPSYSHLPVQCCKPYFSVDLCQCSGWFLFP